MTMDVTERATVFKSGARFFTSNDGKTMFAYRVDSRNEMGPRKATPDDMAKHAAAWADYCAAATFAPPAEETADEAEPVEPAKRKPGRPRKA